MRKSSPPRPDGRKHRARRVGGRHRIAKVAEADDPTVAVLFAAEVVANTTKIAAVVAQAAAASSTYRRKSRKLMPVFAVLMRRKSSPTHHSLQRKSSPDCGSRSSLCARARRFSLRRKSSPTRPGWPPPPRSSRRYRHPIGGSRGDQRPAVADTNAAKAAAIAGDLTIEISARVAATASVALVVVVGHI